MGWDKENGSTAHSAKDLGPYILLSFIATAISPWFGLIVAGVGGSLLGTAIFRPEAFSNTWSHITEFIGGRFVALGLRRQSGHSQGFPPERAVRPRFLMTLTLRQLKDLAV